MFNVCPKCGEYRADKYVEGAVAICPECGHRHPFTRLPLALITGASGTGKTSVCQTLLGRDTGWVLLDGDLLWRPALEERFFEIWLRVAKNIHQSGRPVALFGVGTGIPENLEPDTERRYFASTHYLALVCDEQTQIARLTGRPAWRKSATDAYLAEQTDLNRWFVDEGPHQEPPIALLDTTELSVEDTAAEVEAWLLQIRW